MDTLLESVCPAARRHCHHFLIIPAKAGILSAVIPAKAGIQWFRQAIPAQRE